MCSSTAEFAAECVSTKLAGPRVAPAIWRGQPMDPSTMKSLPLWFSMTYYADNLRTLNP